MPPKPTVLITGANRGIGHEFARQYCASGWKVIATCRRPQAAEALARLAVDHPEQIEIARLEVTDRRDLETLARSFTDRPLNLLINNANEFGPVTSTLEEVGYEHWPRMFAVNCIGQLRISQLLLPALERAQKPKVVAIGSKMASLELNRFGQSYLYRSTKSALHAVMRSFAQDVRDRGIVVAVLHPGWVPTEQKESETTDGVVLAARLRRGMEILREFGGRHELVAVEDSVRGMRQVIESLTMEETGLFLDWKGRKIPW